MPLAPVYRDVFSLSRAQTGLLMTALFLGVVVASWASGRATDRIGAKSVMLGAVLTVGTSFACLSLAPAFPVLLALLFAVGLFYSAVTPSTNSEVLAWASGAFWMRAMALKQAGLRASVDGRCRVQLAGRS